MGCEQSAYRRVWSGIVDQKFGILSGQIKSSPNALLRGRIWNGPGNIEQRDCLVGFDFAHKMDSTGIKWELLGRKAEISRQFGRGYPIMHLVRRLFVKRHMMLTFPIIREKVVRLLIDFGLVLQIGIFPDMAVIFLMKTFDIAITGGIVDRGKDQFRAYLQGDSYNFAQDIGMSGPAAKAAFVIHLGVAGYPDGLPDVNEKADGIFCTSLGKGQTCWVAGDHINRKIGRAHV